MANEGFPVDMANSIAATKNIFTAAVVNGRKQQMKDWEKSEMNRMPTTKKESHMCKVQFNDDDVFISACKAQDFEELDFLLDKNADINIKTLDGVTGLHQSIIDGNEDVVKYLVERGANIDVQDNEGWTPLHTAVVCDSLSIVKFLEENGADLTITNFDKELPIDLANDEDIKKYIEDRMQEQNIDINVCREKELALMSKDCEEWIKIGQYLDKPHPLTGASALHVASAKGYDQVLKLLIKAGANVRSKDYDGWTPLHAAAHWGQQSACEILLDNGANIHDVNNVGQNPLLVVDKGIATFLEEYANKVYSNNNILQQNNTIAGTKRTPTKSPVKDNICDGESNENIMEPPMTNNFGKIQSVDRIERTDSMSPLPKLAKESNSPPPRVNYMLQNSIDERSDDEQMNSESLSLSNNESPESESAESVENEISRSGKQETSESAISTENSTSDGGSLTTATTITIPLNSVSASVVLPVESSDEISSADSYCSSSQKSEQSISEKSSSESSEYSIKSKSISPVENLVHKIESFSENPSTLSYNFVKPTPVKELSAEPLTIKTSFLSSTVKPELSSRNPITSVRSESSLSQTSINTRPSYSTNDTNKSLSFQSNSSSVEKSSNITSALTSDSVSQSSQSLAGSRMSPMISGSSSSLRNEYSGSSSHLLKKPVSIVSNVEHPPSSTLTSNVPWVGLLKSSNNVSRSVSLINNSTSQQTLQRPSSRNTYSALSPKPAEYTFENSYKSITTPTSKLSTNSAGESLSSPTFITRTVAQLAQASNSVSAMASSPYKHTLRSWHIPTVNQSPIKEESESERKAKSKMQRAARRSTQGITITQINEARNISADMGKWKSSTLQQNNSDEINNPHLISPLAKTVNNRINGISANYISNTQINNEPSQSSASISFTKSNSESSTNIRPEINSEADTSKEVSPIESIDDDGYTAGNTAYLSSALTPSVNKLRRRTNPSRTARKATGPVSHEDVVTATKIFDKNGSSDESYKSENDPLLEKSGHLKSSAESESNSGSSNGRSIADRVNELFNGRMSNSPITSLAKTGSRRSSTEDDISKVQGSTALAFELSYYKEQYEKERLKNEVLQKRIIELEENNKKITAKVESIAITKTNENHVACKRKEEELESMVKIRDRQLLSEHKRLEEERHALVRIIGKLTTKKQPVASQNSHVSINLM